MASTELTAHLLDRSIAGANRYLLSNVLESGELSYQYDLRGGITMDERHAVRQAGALWAIACMQRFRPSAENLLAIRRALRFYALNTETTPTGFEYFVAPGDDYGQTGTMALVCLALSEFLRSESELNASERDGYKMMYKHYIEFLLTLQNEGGHFHRQYDHKDGVGFGSPSPYFDGEGLLALTHAAKYHGFGDLREMIIKVAYSMYNANVQGPTSVLPANERTKGFYQWGSMAFYELYTSDWCGTAKNDLARWTISMGHWIIDTHDVMNKTGNTSYAFEGLLSARQCALMAGDLPSMRKFDAAADISLPRLISWQINGPTPGEVAAKYAKDERATGAILSHPKDPILRVDATQHFLHALILCREYRFPPE